MNTWRKTIEEACRERGGLVRERASKLRVIGTICLLLRQLECGGKGRPRRCATLFRALAVHRPGDSLTRMRCRTAMEDARGAAAWQLAQAALALSHKLIGSHALASNPLPCHDAASCRGPGDFFRSGSRVPETRESLVAKDEDVSTQSNLPAFLANAATPGTRSGSRNGCHATCCSAARKPCRPRRSSSSPPNNGSASK